MGSVHWTSLMPSSLIFTQACWGQPWDWHPPRRRPTLSSLFLPHRSDPLIYPLSPEMVYHLGTPGLRASAALQHSLWSPYLKASLSLNGRFSFSFLSLNSPAFIAHSYLDCFLPLMPAKPRNWTKII